MFHLRLAIGIIALLCLLCAQGANAASSILVPSRPLVQSIETSYRLSGLLPGDTIEAVFADGVGVDFLQEGQEATFGLKLNGPATLTVRMVNGTEELHRLTPVPLYLSIVPPLIAILLALVFREVVVSLFIGIFSGAFIIFYYQGVGIFYAFFKGLFAVVDTYILAALNDASHLSIIVFSMLIGGMVALVTMNGGMAGVVDRLSRYAKSRLTGQLMTFLMGLVIFFDDYANTLVVGNTMRPLTDRLRISREKLAYLVDSTSAPIAAVAFVTTWIGAELSYIQSGLVHTQITESAYQVFLKSLPFSFYPIFTLFFVAMVIFTGRDFGPMYKAERAAFLGNQPEQSKTAADTGELQNFKAIDTAVPRWYNAIVPVMVLIVSALVGLVYTGIQNADMGAHNLTAIQKLSSIIGASDSYKALLWASLLSLTVAIAMSVAQRIMGIAQAINSVVAGFKLMFNAILILILAWGISHVAELLHTASFITNFFGQSSIQPFWIPAITFMVSALVSFSTGTSWGTMAIVYPLILPVVWALSQAHGFDYPSAEALFHQTVASVLAGAVLGDHISPISDTTILSSLASSCNHIKHVRTQMPYALLVGATAMLVGVLPAALGVSPWWLIAVGLCVLYLAVRYLGKTQG
jgi:Na+/H+ antiporter NhaC